MRQMQERTDAEGDERTDFSLDHRLRSTASIGPKSNIRIIELAKVQRTGLNEFGFSLPPQDKAGWLTSERWTTRMPVCKKPQRWNRRNRKSMSL